MVMQAVVSRARMAAAYLGERWRRGVPTLEGDPARGTVFLVDGVGGLLLTPVLARKAFRQSGLPLATYVFDWHRGPRGEMLADLVCRRRNQRAALRLARLIRCFRRCHPESPLHVLGYSGGAGIAVFAAEKLGRRARLNTLILGAPALSSAYCLERALSSVDRCYAFVCRRDVVYLGLATAVFGTIDRRHGLSAGLVGFDSYPQGVADPGGAAGRLRQISWEPSMRHDGHCGQHTGCATVDFICHRIVPLLAGDAGGAPVRLDGSP